MKSTSPIKYHDHFAILLAVPLINMLNYYLTYSSIQFNFFFLATYLIDTATGYLSLYGARAVILYFDRRLPWEENFWKRAGIQFPLVCIVFLGLIILCTEAINYLASNNPIPLSFYTHDLFIFLIWGFFINVAYIGFYFYIRYFSLQRKREEAVRNNILLVKTGKTETVIPLATVLGFYILNDLVYCIHTGGRIPVSGYTLDKLEALLDPEKFNRANRQCLITRTMVHSIKKEEYGKISVTIRPEFDWGSPVLISRHKAVVFKKWFDQPEGPAVHP